MCMLEDALEQLQISPLSCELIRSKDGIAVYRIETQKEKMVLKVFEKPENRREIENYRLLGKVPIWAEKSKELLLSGELQQRFMKWMG